MSKIYMYGIDISRHNGNIDLTPYKDQFVIIRAGYGKSTVDPKFARNVAECKRLGIPFGVYWYSYALSVADAKKEAAKCLQTIHGLDIKVGVWFDMEDADGYKGKHGALKSDLISEMCKAFCSAVEDAGYYAGIYASAYWFRSYIKGCGKYDKWVASWGSNDGKIHGDTSSIGTLHQFTSKPLDRSIMYAPLSRYDMSKPKTDPKPEEPKEEPKPEEPKTEPAKPAEDPANVIPAWAVEEFQKAMDYGITDGSRPGANATRCETAVMIKRGLEYILNKLGVE